MPNYRVAIPQPSKSSFIVKQLVVSFASYDRVIRLSSETSVDFPTDDGVLYKDDPNATDCTFNVFVDYKNMQKSRRERFYLVPEKIEQSIMQQKLEIVWNGYGLCDTNGAVTNFDCFRDAALDMASASDVVTPNQRLCLTQNGVPINILRHVEDSLLVEHKCGCNKCRHAGVVGPG